jgi:hypothetical protein
VIDAAGADNLLLQYDVFHMQIVEGDLAKTIERLLARIGHIQIADVPDRNEPGTGEINFPGCSRTSTARLPGLDRRRVHPQGRHRRRIEMGDAVPEIISFTKTKSLKNSGNSCRALRALAGRGHAPYECDGLTAYRRVPMVVALPENRGAGAENSQDLPRARRAGGAARRRHGPLGRRASARRRRAAVARQVHARAAHRSRGRASPWCSRGCATRRFGRGGALRPVLRAGSLSQIACSIGGNVAENSGGVHCLKYGLTVHNVLRVRGYTIEGEPVDFGSEALDSPGYDLLALAIGSEGLLAVTTEVTVKLLPKARNRARDHGVLRRR